MGSMADFCRGSVTGLSMAYWKKSPSFGRRRRRRDALAAGPCFSSAACSVACRRPCSPMPRRRVGRSLRRRHLRPRPVGRARPGSRGRRRCRRQRSACLSMVAAVGRRPQRGEQLRLDHRPRHVQRLIQVHLEGDGPAARPGPCARPSSPRRWGSRPSPSLAGTACSFLSSTRR